MHIFLFMIQLYNYLVLEELHPILLDPGTGNLTGNKAIPQDSWRDMNAILSAKFDCILLH
jgi:hypothetical protein